MIFDNREKLSIIVSNETDPGRLDMQSLINIFSSFFRKTLEIKNLTGSLGERWFFIQIIIFNDFTMNSLN